MMWKNEKIENKSTFDLHRRNPSCDRATGTFLQINEILFV